MKYYIIFFFSRIYVALKIVAAKGIEEDSRPVFLSELYLEP